MSKQSKIIKKLIEESGRSYVDLEKSIGIKKSTLQRYASGTTAKIPITAIEKIAAAFGVSPRYIMGWEEVQKKGSTIADATLRMKSDADFMSVIEMLLPVDKEKLGDVKQMLDIMLK